MANSLETMKTLRENELPVLLKEFNIQIDKQKRVLLETSKRTLQGAI